MRPGEEENFEDFRLHCLEHRQIGGHPRFRGLRSKLASIRPDVVQSFLSIGWVALDAALLRAPLDYRLFTSAHTTASVFPLANRDSYLVRARAAAKLRRAVVAGSAGEHADGEMLCRDIDCADVAVRFFGVEAHKIDLAPLGVDTELLSPISTPQQRLQGLAACAARRAARRGAVYLYGPVLGRQEPGAAGTGGGDYAGAGTTGEGGVSGRRRAARGDRRARRQYRLAVRAAPGLVELLPRR